MVDESQAAPRVIISDASGGEYTCFELFTENAEWHARVAWALFREEASTLKHGWSLKDVEPNPGFNVESLTPVDVDEHGGQHDVVDAVVELLERSTATPSCHISIDADIVDEDLAAKLTPWYRARAGSSEGLLDIFRQVQISGTPPRLRPSYAWALSGSLPGLGAIVAHADRPEGASEMSSEELERQFRSEDLMTLWWAIPNGVTQSTGVIVAGRVWLLPVGETPQAARLVSFVFDRVVPYAPALLPSGALSSYQVGSDGARSGRALQGRAFGPSTQIDFVQADRRLPGSVRLVDEDSA